MLHSQTKVKYLNCPFITRIEDLNETVYQRNNVAESKNLDKSTMFDLIKESVDTEIINRYGDDYIAFVEKFLLNTIDKKYTKILYRISKQELLKEDFINIANTSKVESESNPIINFITTAYRDTIGSSIDREYSSTISWTVIPLSMNVVAEKIRFNNGSISSFDNIPDINVNSKKNNVAQILDPRTHVTDNECQKLESHIMKVRSNRRGTIHRDPIVNTEKKDTYSCITEPVNTKSQFSSSLSYDSSYEPSYASNSSYKLDYESSYKLDYESNYKLDYESSYKSSLNQIQLDGNTRASAHIIRERLANPYKSYRLRNNPDAYKRSIKINRSIKNTNDNTNDTTNDTTTDNISDNPSTIIKKSSGICNYVQENVEIRRSDKILRFRPLTGKILFDNETCIDKSNSKFLSVMIHNTILHITLHDLNWI